MKIGWFLALCFRTPLAAIGQSLNDFLDDFLDDFLYENLNCLHENLKFPVKITDFLGEKS